MNKTNTKYKDFTVREGYMLMDKDWAVNNRVFEDDLCNIIQTYKDGSVDPLDGDEVDKLIEHLRNQINLIEGNITNKEYDKLEGLR